MKRFKNLMFSNYRGVMQTINSKECLSTLEIALSTPMEELREYFL